MKFLSVAVLCCILISDFRAAAFGSNHGTSSKEEASSDSTRPSLRQPKDRFFTPTALPISKPRRSRATDVTSLEIKSLGINRATKPISKRNGNQIDSSSSESWEYSTPGRNFAPNNPSAHAIQNPTSKPREMPDIPISSWEYDKPSIIPSASSFDNSAATRDEWELDTGSKSSSKPSNIPSSIPKADPLKVKNSQKPTIESNDDWELDPDSMPSSKPSYIPSSIPTAGPPQAPANSQKPTIESNDDWELDPGSMPSSKPSNIPSSIPTVGPSQTHNSNDSTSQPSFKKSDKTTNAPSKERRKKPNILLIFADDVGTGDIPQYWNSGFVDMPNIGKLSENGVTFKDAHATPLCAPSRYMLLSGNYQHRGRNANGSWNLEYEHNQFQPHQKSISEVLREAGYHTGMFGKWHLGAKIPPFGSKNRTNYLTAKEHDWTLPLYDGPQDIGFDSSFITVGGIQESPYSFFRDGMLTTSVEKATFWEAGTYQTVAEDESVIIRSGEGDPEWDSTSYNMILVNETEKFLDDHIENTNDPFFLYVALGSVHIPHSPPRHYLDGTPVRGEYPDKHMDMLHEMDKVVGSLVSMIEERKISEDTIIIFTSDNGGIKNPKNSNLFHQPNGPLRGNKGEIWEGGHRVPLIMRYDGKFPPKQERHHPLGLNDIYATICDLVGVNIPFRSASDSVSFADYIVSNNTKSLRETLAVFDYKQGMLQNDSFRYGDLKVVRSFKEHSREVSSVELYDLKSDLSETTDLSQEPKYTTIIDQMLQNLTALGPCPADVKGIFTLQRFDDMFNATCKFFEKKPFKCTKYVEGELFCNSICGRHHKACHPEEYPKVARKPKIKRL
jgi:arylsulfatase A-like enzyme